jgi:predicted RNA-binding protein with PIN domain
VEDRAASRADELDGCRRLIVDGLNALGSRPDGWWRDRPAAMERLVRRLGEFADREEIEVEVVFDGRPHARVEDAGEDAGVSIGFASGGANAADREIAARVRADADPAAVVVVTSDRRLTAAVKAAGGRSVGAGGFVRRRLPEPG